MNAPFGHAPADAFAGRIIPHERRMAVRLLAHEPLADLVNRFVPYAVSEGCTEFRLSQPETCSYRAGITRWVLRQARPIRELYAALRLRAMRDAPLAAYRQQDAEDRRDEMRADAWMDRAIEFQQEDW